MSGLPRGWVESRLGDVLEPRSEKADPSNVPDLPFLGLEDVEPYSGRVIGYGSTADMKSAVARFSKGDLLFGRLRPYLQKILIADCDGAASAEFIVMRTNQYSHLGFFSALLRSDKFLEYTTLVSSGDRPRVSYESIADFNLALPPLAEQKRIVAKLDALNAKSARARTELARIETLVSRYKQAVLSKAFSGELTREWPLVSLDLLSDVIFDGPFGSNLKSADYTADGPRVVRLENIGARQFIEEKRTHISDAKFRSLARHVLQANDLLFSSFVSEEIRACLFPANTDFQAINKADCFCIRLDTSKVDPQFALLQVTSETTYRHFVQQVHGATRPRINLSQLKSYRLLAPSLEEQREVVRRIESAFAKIDRLAKESRRALELVGRMDQAILAKAFRGELVPQDENDEPAEKLLKRISAERAAAPKISRTTARRARSMQTAKEFLNQMLESWPAEGISFQDLSLKFAGTYEELKDAVFGELSEETSKLRQVFDESQAKMMLRKQS